ncbi:hypothetical protein F4809DRAFT_457977 [Biscogniauxia mediterranea]|nr:hypothetical protein F4809DRAFT_457977 [Biscogniauxia mediterranea]
MEKTSLLLSLPTELISQIVEQFQPGPDNNTLRALARTSQTLKYIAERHLYSSTAFRTHGRFHAFHDTLKARPELRTYVRDLALPWSTRFFDYDPYFDPLDLCSLPNLTSFLSESPFCNKHYGDHIGSTRGVEEGWSRVVENFLDSFREASLLTNPGPGGERPLGHLRHLTLHWTGSSDMRLWEATPFCPIFLLPTLHSLEISCMEIRPQGPATNEDNERLSRLSRQTNLQSLTMTRCNIPTSDLVTILSFPRALETFSFLQPFFQDIDDNGPPVGTDDMGTLNAAIAQHASSLRRLELVQEPSWHALRSVAPPRQLALELSEFRALTHLHLGGGGRKEKEEAWELTEPLPPALASLRLSDLWTTRRRRPSAKHALSGLHIRELVAGAARRGVAFELDVGFVPAAGDALPPLVQDLVPLFSGEEQAQDRDPADRPVVEEEEEEGKKNGPRHRVRYMALQRSAYIAPYLCDEVRPAYKLCYDSWRPGGGYVEERDRTERIYLDIGGAGNSASYRDYLPSVPVWDLFG